MKKNILLIPITGLILSCSTMKALVTGEPELSEPSKKQKAIEEVDVEKFNKAAEAMDLNRFGKAQNLLENILESSPSTNLEFVTMFNLGLCYENLKKCHKAVSTYRKLVKVAGKRQRRLQAQALYRLGYSYECLGEDTKVISSLHDVVLRSKALPPEVALAEVPARLAGAYARMGNRKMAKVYFQMAERGIKTLGTYKTTKTKRKELLARTLYMMGSFDPKHYNADESEKFLYNLEYVQRYLLRSVEMDHEKWSARSAEKILQAYDRVWDLIRQYDLKIKNSKAVLERRKNEKQKIELVRAAVNSIALLKRERFPLEDPSELVNVLFSQIDKKEIKLQTYLAGNVLGNEETQASKRRFGEKLKGRFVTPKKR